MSTQDRAPRSQSNDRFRGGIRSDRMTAGDEARSLELPLRSVLDRPVLTFLLLFTAQFSDLVTFSLAVGRHGPSGELGPLGLVYAQAGILAVALVKMGIVAIVLMVLARYPWQRAATPRRLALIVATIGVFGAFTNVAALI